MATYQLKLSLSDGTEINAGTFETFTEADKESVVSAVIAALGGSPVFGVVDSDNNIIISGLADGTYFLKYEQADGSTTNIGELTVGEGEVTPPYTNIAPNGTWELNKRFNSSFQTVEAAGQAIFTVPVSGLLTTDPNIVRIKFANGFNFKETNTREAWKNASGTTLGAYQIMVYKGSSGSYVTQESNGAYKYNIAYISDYNSNTNYALKTPYANIAYICFSIAINSGTTITEADLPDIIMTINEEITD